MYLGFLAAPSWAGTVTTVPADTASPSRVLALTAAFGTPEDCSYDGPTHDGYTCIPDGVASITYFVTGSGSCVFTGTFDWDDGQVETHSWSSQFTATHEYDQAGVYVAQVTGSGASTDPDTTCTFAPSTFVFEVPAPAFQVSFSTFIPGNYLVAPPHPQSFCVHRQSAGNRNINVRRQLVFHADDRGFDPNATSFRTRQVVTVIPEASVNPSGLEDGSILNQVGKTRSYATAFLPIDNDTTTDTLADNVINDEDDDGVLHDCALLHDQGRASTADMHVTVERTNDTTVEIHLFGKAGNPLVFGAPAIDWDFVVTVGTSDGTAFWTFEGAHDGFPAYEVYIDGQAIYTYNPPGVPPFTTQDVSKLFPPLDVQVPLKIGNL